MRKVRIGILVDTAYIPMWAYTMLGRIKAGKYASMELIIQTDLLEAEASKSSADWRRLPSRIVRNVLRSLETWLMDRVKSVPDAFEPKEFKKLLSDVPVVEVSPIRTTLSDHFSDKDIDRIKPFDIDVLVCLGFRPLRGEILELPKYGVWSYHHGDKRVNRGGPPGFWETMQGWPETGTDLQILSDDADNCRILYSSWSCTVGASISQNKNNIYWKSLSFLPRKLEELYLSGEEAFFRKLQEENAHPRFYCNDSFANPTNAELSKLLLRKLFEKISSKIRNTFYFDQWILMFDIRSGMSSSFSRFQKIIPPKDRFWADPHLLYKDAKYYVFFEEYLYQLGKGHISLIVMDAEGNYENPVVVLHKPYHLSYPFVFEWQEELYVMPETHANKTIEIYRCVKFPLVWEFEKNIMEDVSAVDATLFQHQDKWWLFVNIAENEGASLCDELFLFHSESPLSSEWIPHPRNPIISDIKKSRPAGRVFERNGRIYRPSQIDSPHYGYGTNLNEIIRLTETEYEEKPVASIEPKWDKNITGAHTFNYGHGLTLIDARLRRRK
jgi:hypothetical protein